jgi:hypothetical protein
MTTLSLFSRVRADGQEGRAEGRRWTEDEVAGQTETREASMRGNRDAAAKRETYLAAIHS